MDDRIKYLAKLRTENQQNEEYLNKLRAQHFELLVKCNRRKNQLANIHEVARKAPEKLIGITNNLSKILEAVAPSQPAENTLKSPPNLAEPQEASTSSTTPAYTASPTVPSASKNKAHVVKPHMVNGHILYIPTINLTRVNAEGTAEVPTNGQTNVEEEAESNSSANEASLGVIEEESALSQPSTSTGKRAGHSTLLSGTFQEVKIYLNSSDASASRDLCESNVNMSRGSGGKRQAASASGGVTTRRKRRSANTK